MKLTVFYEHVRETCRQTGKSLVEVAAMIKEEGIFGVEMDYYELQNDELLVKKLEDVGIPIHSVYVMFDWGNHPFDRSYRKVLQKLSDYGIRNVLAIPGMVEEYQDREKCKKRMCRVLRKMCRYAKKLDIQVYMEDYDDKRAVFATAKEVQWFMMQIPELSCAFDTGNFLYSDEDALQVLPLLLDRIGYVHCKDRSFTIKEGEHPKETITGQRMYSSGVGSGVIPMKELVMQILKSGYNGCFAIEHFGSQSQLEDMQSSARFLQECFKHWDSNS